MGNRDIRWIQRFSNYRKALTRLSTAIALSKERDLSDLEKQGLIQAFEFTCDMGWKTLQDYITDKGYVGERDKALRIIVDAAGRGLIDEQHWRSLYQARCKTSHSYDEEIANDISERIVAVYHGTLIQLETRMQLEKINEEKQENQKDLEPDNNTPTE